MDLRADIQDGRYSGSTDPTSGFRHAALLYAGDDDFVERALPFVREGAGAGEAVLVAVAHPRGDRLRAALGPGVARAVRFVDMERIGRNPACIIPVWRQFLAEHGGDGRPVRGIGEPVWPGREADEIDECRRHESLLNLAFGGGPAWSLLCPYDTERLPPEALQAAACTHAEVVTPSGSQRSASYLAPGEAPGPFDGDLPAPPPNHEAIAFDHHGLGAVRRFAFNHAARAGIGATRAADLVLAVNELATNSVRYGGGRGVLAIWEDGGQIVCEVRDVGRMTDPLAGRKLPDPAQPGGRGLFMVNHLSDLVQIRSQREGNVVRMRMSAHEASALDGAEPQML